MGAFFASAGVTFSVADPHLCRYVDRQGVSLRPRTPAARPELIFRSRREVAHGDASGLSPAFSGNRGGKLEGAPMFFNVPIKSLQEFPVQGKERGMFCFTVQ